MVLAALREGAEAIRSGDWDVADLRGLIGRLETAERFGLPTEAGSSIAHGLDGRWIRRKLERASIPRVPSGFSGLDEHLRGGMPPKALGVLVARTGVGKTLGLVHIAKHALLYGFPVLFVTLEVTREEIEDRFDATLTRVPKSQLLDMRREVDAARALWVPKSGEDIVVVEAEPGAFGPGHLDALAERLRKDRGFDPHLLCLDYADLMAAPSKYEQRRFEIEGIYAGLKAFGKRGRGGEGSVVWTASQSNRKGAGELITTLHMAEADVKGQMADVVISMNQSESEKHDKVVRFYVAKNRLGPGGASPTALQMDLDTGTLVRGSATYGTRLPPAPGTVVALDRKDD
jgi:replicative DNA helicase